MAASRQLLLRLLNTASNSGRLFSSSAALTQRPRTHYSDDSEVPHGESAVYKKVLKLQRPTTVKYEECFPNPVSLIDATEFPFKVCSTDRFGVYTAVRVNASTGAYRSFGVVLSLWDEMAVQHLKINDLVYVLGRLGSYVKVDENGKYIRRYEVHVKEVNFVSRNGLGSAYQNLVNLDPEVSFEEIKQKSRDSLHLWQIFFASPSEWWDNRNHKRNPRTPDFKHKDTGETLWLKDNDPPWVRKQLQLHDSRLYRQSSSEHRNAWSHLSPLVYE